MANRKRGRDALYGGGMAVDPHWERWLYETHHRAELCEWATRLQYFRFCRAVGGHANDGDALRVALRADTESALLTLFAAVDVVPVSVEPDAPTPRPGVAYGAGEYAKFPSRIGRFPQLGQPGHVEIDGAKAFVWVRDDRLTISLADPDDPFAVTADTVGSAVVIEARLARFATTIIDPPLDDRHCICPKYHSELWA